VNPPIHAGAASIVSGVDRGRRQRALTGLLDAITTGDLEDWLARPAAADLAYDGGLRVLATTLSLRWQDAWELGRSLDVPGEDDLDGRWLHLAALAWASSGDPRPGSGEPLDPLEAERLPDVAYPLGRFAGYVAVEAAMAHGRLDLADDLVDRLGADLWTPLGHPFDAMVVACRARLLTFRGDVAAACVVLDAAAEPVPGSSPEVILAGTECLVRGNDAEPADVRRLAALVQDRAAEPRDLLGAGSQMLAAFGLIAVGDVVEAVRRLLVAGRDADLSALNVIDRALGLELLVALAAAEGNTDDAEVWRDRALPLLGSPMADSTVARLLSRVELLAGRPAEAVAWAEQAVERARAADRGIEAAEGEIVLSRARLALRGPGDRARAVRGLERMVAEAESRGHRAARSSAARALRPLGQRLRPLSGSGWAGLTGREAEVARAVADGATNAEIARRLTLSEHTVRAHVSRVLAAFGVAGRSALPAALGPTGYTPELARLTPRQTEVADLVAEGLANQAIARSLGLSTRTVERHVSDILLRWGLSSRTELARAKLHGPVRAP